MEKSLVEILRDEVDEYFVKAVLREDKSSPRQGSDAVSSPFISVRLASVSKPNVIGSGSRPTLTFFELNPDGSTNYADKEIMDQIRACKDEQGNYDPAKLKENVYHFEGVFYEFRSPVPFYVYNNKGERQVFPSTNKDKDRPVIGQIIPMFLYKSQIENADMILNQAVASREQVPIEEARQAVEQQNRYHNYRAHKILSDYVAEEGGSSEETVE